MNLLSLRTIDRYVLLDTIAEGGAATVFRALQASPQGISRLIIMKLFKQDYLGHSNLTIQTHRQQIQIMIGLNHPNIVQLYDIGEERPGVPFLAMEYVHGKSLRNLVISLAKARRVLKSEFVAHVGHEVAKALHYAHTFQGNMSDSGTRVLHRNVSPQNILISYDGEVKLIEFAVLSEKKEKGNTKSQLIRGRSGYTTPEELDGKELDARSDIFSLGIVLWEALTGNSLFTSESRMATFDKIKSCEKYVRPPSSLNKAVPKELDAVVLKALEKDPAKRYQTAQELVNALERIILLSFQDFSPRIFGEYLHELLKTEITAESAQLKAAFEEGERIAKKIVPSGKNVFLKKYQGGGASDETEDTKIMMGKVAEGAVGSRNLDISEKELGTVEINKDALKGGPKYRGGFTKRINSEGTDAMGGVSAIDSGLFDTAPLKQTASASSLSRPINRKKDLESPEARQRSSDNLAWIIKIAVVVAIVFGLLPHFGIKIWSIASLAERFSPNSTIGRGTASDPVKK